MEPISEADAKRRIEELKNLDTNSLKIEKLKEKIDTSGLRNEGILLDEDTPIYRARIIKNQPSRIKELNYPPEDVTGLNRANREHDPVFYASSGAGGAVFELYPSPGDRVAVVKWRTTEELMLNTVGYSPEVLSKFESFRDPEDIPGKQLSDTESLGNSMLRKYLTEIFTQQVPENQKHRHKLTAAIAEIWRSGPSIDGLMYPAVSISANYDNLAIETGVVDRALSPVSAEYIEIQEREDQKIEINVLDTCNTIQDGEIQWNGHGRQWKLEDDGAWGVFEAEDGRWKVTDSSAGGVRPIHDPDFDY